MCVISEERVYLVMFFCIVCLIWILFKKSSKFWESPFSSRNYNIGLAWQKWPINVLTILTGKNFFTQFNTSFAAWLILTFSICLHNQLSSIHLLPHMKEYRCLKKVIHQIDSNYEWLLLLASFCGKIWVCFCLDTGKCFFLEVSF